MWPYGYNQNLFKEANIQYEVHFISASLDLQEYSLFTVYPPSRPESFEQTLFSQHVKTSAEIRLKWVQVASEKKEVMHGNQNVTETSDGHATEAFNPIISLEAFSSGELKKFCCTQNLL